MIFSGAARGAVKKHALKYLIEAVMFVDLCAVAAVGLLMGFVIPRGSARFAPKSFLGLHRHDWGTIHLYLALLLLMLLAVHLWLNWTWIVQTSRRYWGGYWQKGLWLLAGAWVLVLLLAWLTVKPG